MHWQVQEMKQRLSEVLRAAEADGVQYVTRHGKEVAVVMSIDAYRQLFNRRYRDLTDALLRAPRVLTDNDMKLFERSRDVDERKDPFAGWAE